MAAGAAAGLGSPLPFSSWDVSHEHPGHPRRAGQSPGPALRAVSGAWAQVRPVVSRPFLASAQVQFWGVGPTVSFTQFYPVPSLPGLPASGLGRIRRCFLLS